MSVRHAAYIVVLDDNIRADGPRAQATLTALRMIHGVTAVTPVEADYGQVIAAERRDYAWRNAIVALAQRGPDEQEGS